MMIDIKDLITISDPKLLEEKYGFPNPVPTTVSAVQKLWDMWEEKQTSLKQSLMKALNENSKPKF